MDQNRSARGGGVEIWGCDRKQPNVTGDMPYISTIQNLGGTGGRCPVQPACRKEREHVSVICMEEDRCLTAAISGELDHHRAREVMEELDRQIDAALPKTLTLDLSGLTFTDSSGIAVVLRTFQRMRRLQGTMVVVNTPSQAWRVFQAAGLDKLVQFRSVPQ